MTIQANPFQTSLEPLLEQLNTLQGLFFHLEYQLDSFHKIFSETLQDSDPNQTTQLLGTRVIFCDLTEYHEDGFLRKYTSGHFTSKNEEILKVADDLLYNNASWSISQSFEAFETFCKDIISTILLIYPGKANNNQIDKWKAKNKLADTPTNLHHWKQFTRFAYRTNEELFRELRKLAPTISEGEVNNNRGMNLIEWYAVASEVRHAATHSNSIIKSSKFRNWPDAKLDILNHVFGGRTIDSGYVLEIRSENTKMNIRIFAEYAVLIFKCMSIEYGYDWKSFHTRA